jgi:hypothetical protein
MKETNNIETYNSDIKVPSNSPFQSHVIKNQTSHLDQNNLNINFKGSL